MGPSCLQIKFKSSRQRLCEGKLKSRDNLKLSMFNYSNLRDF